MPNWGSILGDISQIAGKAAQGNAQGQVAQGTVQQRQDQLAQDRAKLLDTLYKSNTSQALQGGVLQGIQDVSIGGLPPGVTMGTITGGARPSAVVGASDIGKQIQEHAVANLRNPDLAPPLTPLPEQGVGGKILGAIGEYGGMAGEVMKGLGIGGGAAGGATTGILGAGTAAQTGAQLGGAASYLTGGGGAAGGGSGVAGAVGGAAAPIAVLAAMGILDYQMMRGTGRQTVNTFIAQQGGSDALHQRLLQSTPDGERLWQQLMTVGNNDKAAIKAITDIATQGKPGDYDILHGAHTYTPMLDSVQQNGPHYGGGF